MLFLSVQDVTTYFLWQVYVCVNNLNSKGITKVQIHVLFATQPEQKISEEDEIFIDRIQQKAQVFFYEDKRKEKNYPSSIRPHIIAQHFVHYLELGKETIFYHDCDIIFRDIPPLLNEVIDSIWYVSDTKNYLSSKYIKQNMGEDNFIKMCEIVGIDDKSVMRQDTNCGGAQYIIHNATTFFWQKVELDCETIYVFLERINRQNKIDQALKNNNFNHHGIQSWCADMWAMLWNAIYFKYTIKTHSDLNFSWAKNNIEYWNKNYILHNAGVEQVDAEQYFYKSNYIYHTPFYESFNYINKKSCSFIYAENVKKLSENWHEIELSDLTFLIPVMIDSEDRMDNLLTVVRYLQKHFDTNIIIYEYGKQQEINSALLPKRTTVLFEQGNNELFHRTFYNNKLIDTAKTPFISIYDTDVLIPVSQIIEAVYLLRNNHADVVYPYNGTFVSIDKLSSVIFSRFLEDEFLEENKEKFVVSSTRSFGGCVILNKENYCKAGKENLQFTSWGPEDMERYIRMKLLGYKILRVDGLLYHMHHERGKNSGYINCEKRIAFMEEYSKIFNMKRNELENYVATW